MTEAKPLFVGLDLGGNHVKAALGGGRSADLVWDTSVPSRADEGREGILAALVEAATAVIARAHELDVTVAGVALGTPGVVDRQTGRVKYDVANLPDWKGVDLRGLLEGRLKRPAVVDNDGNAAAFAEARFGAGAGAPTCVMATVGTGIGGGAVVDGVLLRGDLGAGMELGHVPRVDGGRECGCGKQGCLEAYAGGRAMREQWIERLRAGEGRAPGDLDVGDLDTRTLRDLIDRSNVGDALATEILERGAVHLGIGLTAALHLLNPSVLVLGGGVVDGVEWYAATVEATLRDRALAKALDGLSIRRATFGNRAGVIGALALAADEFDRHATTPEVIG